MARRGSERVAEGGVWWAALVVLSAVLLAPLLITDVPPLLDYPNHLARLVLMAAGPDDPVLGPVFTPHWTIIPNLAIDVIGPVLLHLLPVHATGRCLLALALLLNLAGVVTLHRALFRRRSFWPLASGLAAYNSTFLLGFLNWQIASGLGMLFAAGWVTWRERHPFATIAAAAVASVVLFFCHLMGVMFFLILIASVEVHAMRNGRVLLRAAALLPVLAGPLFLSLSAELRRVPANLHFLDPHEKLVQMASPFINYFFSLDMITAVVMFGGVALGLMVGWLAGSPRAILAVVTLSIWYVVSPFDMKGASYFDTRIIVMLGFLLFATTEPVRLPRRATAACLVALFALRMAVVMDVWIGHRRDLDDLRQVIATVPPGARVYQTHDVDPGGTRVAPDGWRRSRMLSNGLSTDWHLSGLLLVERGAFWPGLFANPAQQPIRLRPAYATLSLSGAGIPAHAAFMANPDSGWLAMRGFDFVLMLKAGADAYQSDAVPRCLTLVLRNDFAALFKVHRDMPSCTDGPPEPVPP